MSRSFRCRDVKCEFRAGRPLDSHFAIRVSRSFSFLLPVLLLSCGAFWQSDTQRAVEQARTGEYSAASAVLEPAVAGGDFDRQIVESLYYSWIRQGEYATARERFEAWAAANPAAAPVRLAAGRINHLTGNYAPAIAHFDSILNHAAEGVAASYGKALVLEDTGEREDARAIYDRIIRNFLDNITREPGDLFYVAGAMRATEYFHDANDVYRFVIEANPRHAEAYVAWGDLLASTYNEPESIASYRDALAIDPNLPEANLGLARMLALTEPQRSAEALERALQVNPNYIDGHLFAASQDIEAEQYEKAEQALAKVTAVNPESPEAFSLLASIHFLRGEDEDFERNVQRVLATNPYYSDLYYVLAENCVSLRLYAQAVEFAREAVRLNPRDFRAMNLLGINLLRIGEEAEGKEVLERAYEGDRFNVWTVNTLTLLDSFVNFDRFETPNFRVMLHGKESAVLRPYVTDLLEGAHSELSSKYQFEPAGPIVFEMYPDHGDFAVRTLGLPGLGALGVSFGKLVAMDSPSARPPDSFNWGSTLWHEFAHVITLQITDHKIPRWFSEGISVHEERQAFPGWGDDLKIEYLAAIQNERLLPTAELNNGFIRPKFPEQVLVSYYQASLVVEYIEEKFGFPAIRNMLMLYKDGLSTPEVFEQALDITLDGFDTQFFAWVDARVESIDPQQFQELVSRGQEALAQGDLDAAIENLSAAVEMYPEYSDEHNPYEPLAEAYLKSGDEAAAAGILRQYLTYSETAFDSHLKLAELLEKSGNLAGASRALEGAIYVRPLDLEVHRKFGAVLLALGRHGEAVRSFETLIALNAPDRAGTYYRLAEAYFGDGKREDARRSVLRSLEIAPSYEPALELLLKIREVR